MIRGTVKKLDGTYLDHSDGVSIEAIQEWFAPFIAKGVYGQPEVIQQVEVSPEVLDEQGNVIQEAVYGQNIIPADFTIEYVDIDSIPKSQDELNVEALQFLAETDWKILRHLRQQSLGIATSLTSQEFLELEQERQMAAESIIR